MLVGTGLSRDSTPYERALQDPSLEPLLLDPPLHALIDPALERGRRNLLRLQELDGHWCGLLEGDSCLESEYVLLHFFLGREDAPRVERAARRIRRLQLPDGGWAIYPGGPPEVSASVKAYFVLKLVGDDPESPHMRKARRTIRNLGGVEAANTYTQIYLALFGQYAWDRCPAVAPEIMLLPDWFPLNINRISSWSRAIFVPLSIVWAHRPVVEVPDDSGIQELFVNAAEGLEATMQGPGARFWRTFFSWTDRAVRAVERLEMTPLRESALESAEEWILEHLEDTDGLGAVFPSVVNAILAFRILGYPDDHEAPRSQWRALELLTVDGEETVQVQPSLSPVWDTGHAVLALEKTGIEAGHPSVRKGVRWLLEKEVRREGDWCFGNPTGEPSGWYFQYTNELYPDCDDTALVLLALQSVRTEDEALTKACGDARRRGTDWVLTMQNPDGGWGAFDRGCDAEPLTHIPFADHNAMLDPSCADITGRVLEALVGEGIATSHPAVRAGVQFLWTDQEEDGTWYGRWGCNYLYGTSLALRGLRAAGEDMSDPRCRRAAAWITEHQNEDGGWGELQDSYWDSSRKGRGPSTAAQTAWAVMGLMAAGDTSSRTLRRGILHLLRTQRDDGSWEDDHWTATGFPRVFFLDYHMYDDYFPLRALSRYREVTHLDRPLQPALPSFNGNGSGSSLHVPKAGSHAVGNGNGSDGEGRRVRGRPNGKGHADGHGTSSPVPEAGTPVFFETLADHDHEDG